VALSGTEGCWDSSPHLRSLFPWVKSSSYFWNMPIPLATVPPVRIPQDLGTRSLRGNTVMSHNSHITLLTNLGQFRVPSHLSHPITPHQVPYWNSSSPEHASHVPPTSVYLDPSLSSCSMFLFQSRTIVHYCPVIVSCPDYCINNFIQEYLHVSCCF